MKKHKRVIIIIIVLIVVIGLGIGSYFLIFNKPVENEVSVPEVKVTNEVSEYGYYLEDRDTELFKQKFNELKELLNTEEIDMESYASLVAQLFIIDLYTINNKISKYDIGGLDYVYSEAQDSFKSVVMDTIYKTVVNNLDKKRSQKLPIVSDISVGDIKEATYQLPAGSSVKSYDVNLTWEYEEDLGYDDAGVVTLILNDKKLDVVSYDSK